MSAPYQPFRIVIVGHVDHGKSTLIGRLLHDTGSLPAGKAEELAALSRKRGTDEIEWSFVLDAFQAERDQNITIDTTQIRFRTARREYIIIDAPGHREFLKNMISGAAQADVAILVIDATEGLQEQTRRHAYLLHLLGLRQIAVVVNKMDRIGFDAVKFAAIATEITQYLASFDLTAAAIIPASARQGDMLTWRGERLSWYTGATLLEALDAFVPPKKMERAMRFPVQDVYREGEKRIIVGRVESGVMRVGDEVLFSPTNERTTVTSIEIWPPDAPRLLAYAGEAIGITLADKLFVERGHIGSDLENPPVLSTVFRAHIFWLAKKSLRAGQQYRVRIATREMQVTVQSIERVIDTDSLAATLATEVKRDAIAEVTFTQQDLMPLDAYADNDRTGRVVIYDGRDIAGAGLISLAGYPDRRAMAPALSRNLQEVDHLITRADRARRNGHAGGVFWFTGLSAAGKSTLAMAAEQALFNQGRQVYVLDGDNIRHSLNVDLGFSPEDRVENIRRVGEVAALMAAAGHIVITAFISPYRADREKARAVAQESFHEIYIRADLATCEARDPKGLYKRARAGTIKDFTGVDVPYEAPKQADLVVDTQNTDIESCVAQILQYIEQSVRLPV